MKRLSQSDQNNTKIVNLANGTSSGDAVNKAQLDTKQDLDSDLTAIAGLSPSNDDVVQRKSGGWTNRTPSQLKIDLALTKSDVGLSNADNTSDATVLSAAADDALVFAVAL